MSKTRMQRRRDIRRAVEITIIAALCGVLVAAVVFVAVLGYQIGEINRKAEEARRSWPSYYEEMFRPAEEIDQEAYQAALQRYYVQHQITPIPTLESNTERSR